MNTQGSTPEDPVLIVAPHKAVFVVVGPSAVAHRERARESTDGSVSGSRDSETD